MSLLDGDSWGHSHALFEGPSSKGSKRPSVWLLVLVSFAITGFTLPAYVPGRLPGAYVPQGDRRPNLAEGFMLICLQHLSWPYVGYPALPLA